MLLRELFIEKRSLEENCEDSLEVRRALSLSLSLSLALVLALALALALARSLGERKTVRTIFTTRVDRL